MCVCVFAGCASISHAIILEIAKEKCMNIFFSEHMMFLYQYKLNHSENSINK